MKGVGLDLCVDYLRRPWCGYLSVSPVAGAIAVGRLDPEPALSNFPDAARQAETVADGSALALGIGLAFRLDGFSLLFSLLTSDKPKDKKGRFLTLIIAFMSAMLGTVLSDNLIVMFAFWELKSLLSFLLIGFEGEMLEARNSALQSLIVEPSGSLALFAGIVLIGSHSTRFASCKCCRVQTN